MSSKIIQHDADIAALKRRLDRGLDSVGNPIITGGSGTIPVHNHAGAGRGGPVDAAVLTYTPDDLGDWGSIDPGNVDAALDYLAANSGTGSGNVATDTIWDAKGDLAVGTGSNTASKLTVGANDTFLIADSSTGTGLKWGTSIAAATIAALTADTIALQTGAKTYSSAGTVITDLTTAITLDFASSGMAMNRLFPTVKYKQAGGAIAMYYGYLNVPTIQNDANVTPGPIHAFVDDTTLHTITNSLTLTEQQSFRAHPTYTVASGGIMAITAVNLFRGQVRDFPASSTITTLRGYLYEDVQANSGTITTQIGVDIAALTAGGTNLGIRTASPVQINNTTLKLYSNTGVTNTGTWDGETGFITLLGSNRTYSSSFPTMITMASTVTLDFASATWVGMSFTSTIQYTQAGFLGLGFLNQTVHTNTNGANVAPASIASFTDGQTIQIDAQTKTVNALYSFRSAPITARITSGALTLTEMVSFEASTNTTIGANTTVTTRYGLRVSDVTKSGTLTTQIGVDIAALAQGTTNIGIRNASNHRGTGYLSLYGTGAPTFSTTDGHAGVKKLMVAVTDQAFTTGVVGAEIVGRSRFGGTDNWVEFANFTTIGNFTTPAAGNTRLITRLNGDLAGATNFKTLWAKDENAFESSMVLRARTLFPKPLTLATTTTGNGLPSNNTSAWVQHALIECAIKVNKILYNVTVAGNAANVIRIAIYSENGTQKYVDTTDAVGANTGVRTIDITDITLAPGVYQFLVCHSTYSTTPCTLSTYTCDTLITADIASEPDLGGLLTITAGAAPATIDPTALNTVGPTNRMAVIRLLGTALGS